MGEVGADVVMVVVPFPAQGHLNQLLHFCRLVSSDDLPVHFIGSPTHNRQAKDRLHGWDVRSFPAIRFHDFPVPHFAVPPPDPHSPHKFPTHLQPAFNASLSLRPHLARLLRSLSSCSRRVVVVHDSLMAFAADEANQIPNGESYAFHSVSAFANLLFQWESRGRLEDLSKKVFPVLPVICVDGCFTDEFVGFIRKQHRLTAVDHGRLFNTCRPMERDFIDLISKEPFLKDKKMFAIGPLNPVDVPPPPCADQTSRRARPRHESLEWLDRQPPASVVYVSFGTTSTMCCRQIKELAAGLDRSKQRFVWVLRDADRGDIFASEEDAEVASDEKQSCRGQMKRLSVTVGGRGIVVRGWAPQLEILNHPATAAFMSHCGWNSCMESMSSGVAMVAWPMHSDQPRNALLVTEVLRVGMPVREWERRHELVPAAQVEGAIRRLMGSEGKGMRMRAKALGAAVRESVKDGGSSRKELEAFMEYIARP